MEAPTGGSARLLWIANEIRSGRTLEDVATEIGTDASSLKLALTRHGLDRATRPFVRPAVVPAVPAAASPEELPVPTIMPPVGDQRRYLARLQQPQCALLLGELADAAECQAEGTRKTLVQAVKRLALATGREGTRRVLIEIAAEALRWANLLSGGSGNGSVAGYGDSSADGGSHRSEPGAESGDGHGVAGRRLQVLQTGV